MARPKKNVNAGSNAGAESSKKVSRQQANNGTSSSSAGSQTPVKPAGNNNRFVVMTQWRTAFGCICLAIASYFGYLGYLETRVNTPFDSQKMVQRSGLDDQERYWGSYRPAAYFGMKTRDPRSLSMGLMWYNTSNVRSDGHGFRHWCSSNDEIQKYGWIEHDGRSFGLQEINDSSFLIETSFVKFPGNQYGGDWTARIDVKLNKNVPKKTRKEISLFWYVALDEKSDGNIRPELDSDDSPIGIYGDTKGLGEFQLKFHTNNVSVAHKSYLTTIVDNLEDLRGTLLRGYLRYVTESPNKKVISLPGEALYNEKGEKLKENIVIVQLVVDAPFTLDISYQSVMGISSSSKPIVGDAYTKELQAKQEEFNRRFESVFGLTEKGYTKYDILFAKAALSNMIGGIGYFYGSSRVKSMHTKEAVPYWKAPLYTAVPSRPFFPRGFLWDEGFHGLLIAEWDLDIELDIICHWFDLINVEGWIPREQILGAEALGKVPEEFVTQKNTNANPPTFFLTLKKIITKFRDQLSAKGRLAILERLYPRLQGWFTWYNTTQKGELFGTYRWRGREESSRAELNPKTLTSGLDDYPRASHPTEKERHVDLRCWIAFAASVMADLSRLIGRDDTKYWETYSYLSDNTLLNELHLSPYSSSYSDWGLHTDSVVLRRTEKTVSNNQHLDFRLERATLKQPELRYVDTSFGYVSLFPFLLEILETDSPQLGKILIDIRDPKYIWSKYGLRSLSRSSPLYMKRNTEHDPPYWRGQIWININYLALKALHHYAAIPGPFSEDAKRIYIELRENLVTNVIRQYYKSGYIWEQYNDQTGEGSGCRPFTGWSALTVLIMSEKY